jgi:protein-S-isoprenylcysteine O-methyltransferase Ste14
MRTNIITAVLIVAFATWLSMHASAITWTPLRVTGALIAALALVLLLIARFQLGRSFSFTPQARRLVTTGLYSRLRNPIYLFSSLFIAGLAVASGHPRFLLLLLPVVLLQAIRARKEDRVLHQAFGEEYVHYKARTWF